MYAVIRTGGKQYRVSPGDLLVVERLDGQPGDAVSFGDVLMAGDGDAMTVGAPLIEGAAVSAVLIETRKGEKIKVFKKIRRQGYRRTRGHRQVESVLRVTGVDLGGGKSENWDGKVDLTPRSVLVSRARNLASRDADAGRNSIPGSGIEADTVVVDADGGPEVHAAVVEHYAPDTQLSADSSNETPAATEAAAKPKRARKAAAAPAEGALVEEPISETPAEGPQTVANADEQDGVGAQEGTPKKPRAKKAKPAAEADTDTNEG